MKKLAFMLLAFGSISVFAQNTNFKRNPISVVIEGQIYQNQIRIQNILSQKLELLEVANTHQDLKCEKIQSHGVSVCSFRSRCRNSLTGKKVVTVFVDLHNSDLEFTIKTAGGQMINMPKEIEN